MTALLLAGFAVSSAGNLLTGLAWAVAAAFAVQAVRGLGIAALDVAATTLVQRRVPPHLLGRVFGSLYGGIGVAAALAYLGGLLLDRTPGRVRRRRRRRPAGHRRHGRGPPPAAAGNTPHRDLL